MNKKKSGKLFINLMTLSVLPLLILGAIILVLGTHRFTGALYENIKNELVHTAADANTLMDTLYPGDYHLEGTNALSLYKGDADITNDNTIVDIIHGNTGYEITLYYADTRILTSFGSEYTGTAAPELIVNDVLNTGKPALYDNALIGITKYFAYYMPLMNSDGSTVGMLAIAASRDEVDRQARVAVYPLVLAVIITIIVMIIIIHLFTGSIVNTLIKIRNFTSESSKGNLSAELAPNVISRGDELGEIGEAVLSMQRSMRTLVETDTLTELFNRRSANRRLEQVVEKASSSEAPYCLAIGDIDFFKKVNDTYGHDAGDMVLKKVAETLRKGMRPYGFVARWGGEEFLLVFDHFKLDEAKEALENILATVRAIRIPYEDQVLNVTMTFGLSQGRRSISTKGLLIEADDLLYKGKENGRNQVVVPEHDPLDDPYTLTEDPLTRSESQTRNSSDKPAKKALTDEEIVDSILQREDIPDNLTGEISLEELQSSLDEMEKALRDTGA